MIRKNVRAVMQHVHAVHGGLGRIAFARPFSEEDFESALSFVDYVEIPPGASIGIHRHGRTEEIYFIVEGSGLMTTNGQTYPVCSGDLIVNKPDWIHGLVNDSRQVLKVLVWEVDCR